MALTMNETLKRKIALLPDSPGCYLMKGQGEILYVGKALSLSSRVRSYFSSQPHSAKVQALVDRIDDFDIILAATNLEALVLESNLIKLHRPYYNIKLMDDKHYPYIRISVNEPFPRLTVARRVENDGARYFGPYYGTSAIRQVTGVLRRTFPLRTCKLPLPGQKNVRPCLNYEMGQCLGPCAGLVTEEEYQVLVDEVIAFLKGRYKPVVERLEREMGEAAAEMQFERAAELRDSIKDILGLMEQQNALQTSRVDQDVIAAAQDGLDAMAQVLFIRGGRMLEAQSFALPREGSEPITEVLDGFVSQFYEDRLPAREVIVQAITDPETMEEWLRGKRKGAVTLTLPQRGDKKKLVDNALQNARDALQKRNAREQVVQERTLGASRELAAALSLSQVPSRIEGFDISNTQGSQSVASMVVFVDGQPARKEYRHFNIKTVEGPNDFASLNEALTRRFKRALLPEKPWPLPDLILVDGGPQQLAYALMARNSLGLSVPMFSLAERLEEIYVPDSDEPIILDRHSPALHLIQRIRDEAHRFGITRHRKLRGQASIRSRLEEVPGIGPARRRALLSAFRSIQGITQADVEALAAVPGMNRQAARALYDALHAGEALNA
ncbi:MAG TPA: excinuclease ABC subunit UvrC [Clostridia bacterium]|nr:excinuclease ABC subunit UvrC [Clostridia bacterium]